MEERDKSRGEYELLYAQFRVLQTDYAAKSHLASTLSLQVQELSDLHFDLSKSLSAAQEALALGEAGATQEAQKMAAEVERIRGMMEAGAAAVSREGEAALAEARRAFTSDLVSVQERQDLRLDAVEKAAAASRLAAEEELARVKRAWEHEVEAMRAAEETTIESARCRREEDLSAERARSALELASLRAWAENEMDSLRQDAKRAGDEGAAALAEARSTGARALAQAGEDFRRREAELSSSLGESLERERVLQEELTQERQARGGVERRLREEEHRHWEESLQKIKAEHEESLASVRKTGELREKAACEEVRVETAAQCARKVGELESALQEKDSVWQHRLHDMQVSTAASLRAVEQKWRDALGEEIRAREEGLASTRNAHTAAVLTLKKEHEHALALVWGSVASATNSPSSSAVAAATANSLPNGLGLGVRVTKGVEVSELNALVGSLRAELAGARSEIAACNTRRAALEAELAGSRLMEGQGGDVEGGKCGKVGEDEPQHGLSLAPSSLESAVSVASASLEASYRAKIRGLEREWRETLCEREAQIAGLHGELAAFKVAQPSSGSPLGSDSGKKTSIEIIAAVCRDAARESAEECLTRARLEHSRLLGELREECTAKVLATNLAAEQKIREIERMAATVGEALRKEARDARAEASSRIASASRDSHAAVSPSSVLVVSSQMDSTALSIERAAGEAISAALRTSTIASLTFTAEPGEDALAKILKSCSGAAGAATASHPHHHTSLLSALVAQRDALTACVSELHGRYSSQLLALSQRESPAFSAVKSLITGETDGTRTLLPIVLEVCEVVRGALDSLSNAEASAASENANNNNNKKNMSSSNSNSAYQPGILDQKGALRASSQSSPRQEKQQSTEFPHQAAQQLLKKLVDALDNCAKCVSRAAAVEERGSLALLQAQEMEAHASLNAFRVGEEVRGECEARESTRQLEWDVKFSALSRALIVAHTRATLLSSSSASSEGNSQGVSMVGAGNGENALLDAVKLEVNMAWERLQPAQGRWHPAVNPNPNPSNLPAATPCSFHPPYSPTAKSDQKNAPVSLSAKGSAFSTSPTSTYKPSLLPQLPLSPPPNPLSPNPSIFGSPPTLPSQVQETASSSTRTSSPHSHPVLPHHISTSVAASLVSLSHTFTDALHWERMDWEEKCASLNSALLAATCLNSGLTDALAAAHSSLRLLRSEKGVAAASSPPPCDSSGNVQPGSLQTQLSALQKEHTEALQSANGALVLALARNKMLQAALTAGGARAVRKNGSLWGGAEEDSKGDAGGLEGKKESLSEGDSRRLTEAEDLGEGEGDEATPAEMSELRTALWKARVKCRESQAAAAAAQMSALELQENWSGALGECESRCSAQLAETTSTLIQQCTSLSGELAAREGAMALLTKEFALLRASSLRERGPEGASAAAATTAAAAQQISSLKSALAGANAALAAMQSTASAYAVQNERNLSALARLSSSSQAALAGAKEREFTLQGLLKDATTTLAMTEGEWKAKMAALEAVSRKHHPPRPTRAPPRAHTKP